MKSIEEFMTDKERNEIVALRDLADTSWVPMPQFRKTGNTKAHTRKR